MDAVEVSGAVTGEKTATAARKRDQAKKCTKQQERRVWTGGGGWKGESG